MPPCTPLAIEAAHAQRCSALLPRGRRCHQALDGCSREVLQRGETPLSMATRNDNLLPASRFAVQALLRERGALAEDEEDEEDSDDDKEDHDDSADDEHEEDDDDEEVD